MIWAVVFGILSLLLQWFLNRKANSDMTEWEKKKANHAMFLMKQCTEAGTDCGCSATQDVTSIADVEQAQRAMELGAKQP